MPGKRTEMALSHDEALLVTFQAELDQLGTVADSRRSAVSASLGKRHVRMAEKEET